MSMNITTARKYLRALKNVKGKYATRDTLAREIGVYPEIIAADLSLFDPIINLDDQYNLLPLISELEAYIEKLAEKNKKKHPPRVKKSEIGAYQSIGDFVFKKMTIGGSGLIDQNVELSDHDLRLLKRLINDEQKRRKQG
ncbi:MAG: hypothetical protein ACOX3K_01000 [Bacilli bacterium]